MVFISEDTMKQFQTLMEEIDEPLKNTFKGTLPLRLLAVEYAANITYGEDIIDHKLVKCERRIKEYYGKRGRSTPLRRHYASVPRERICALKDEESDDDGEFEKRMGMPYAETVHINPTTSQGSRESAKDVSSKSNDRGRRSDNGHVVSRSTTVTYKCFSSKCVSSTGRSFQ